MKSASLWSPLLLLLFLTPIACSDDEESPVTGTTELPAVFQKIKNVTDVYVEGDFVVIESKGLPDHGSPYYEGTNWASTLYEAYNGTNPDFMLNPNTITEQNMVFKIPLDPAEDGAHEATPLGPIGVSVNGVAIFNQYAGPNNQPLTVEINSFDQYNGHPQQSGQYHYHLEPLYLTAQNGKEALLGFLLDGFPVYGPEENGQVVTNADLDDYHGHFGATTDYPDGTYHYHVTGEDPYINGAGFFGSPGTVTQ